MLPNGSNGLGSFLAWDIYYHNAWMGAAFVLCVPQIQHAGTIHYSKISVSIKF